MRRVRNRLLTLGFCLVFSTSTLLFMPASATSPTGSDPLPDGLTTNTDETITSFDETITSFDETTTGTAGEDPSTVTSFEDPNTVTSFDDPNNTETTFEDPNTVSSFEDPNTVTAPDDPNATDPFEETPITPVADDQGEPEYEQGEDPDLYDSTTPDYLSSQPATGVSGPGLYALIAVAIAALAFTAKRLLRKNK